MNLFLADVFLPSQFVPFRRAQEVEEEEGRDAEGLDAAVGRLDLGQGAEVLRLLRDDEGLGEAKEGMRTRKRKSTLTINRQWRCNENHRLLFNMVLQI
mgnify:FL=1